MEATDLTDTDRADIAALQLALDLTLADDPPSQGRVDQVRSMLQEESPWRVAKFCSYYQQMRRLELAPWKQPPCWIHTRENAEAILAKGPFIAADDSGADTSDCGPARLTLDMIALGVSRWHPDPVRAVAEARRSKGA
jgi:hypothetical protein